MPAIGGAILWQRDAATDSCAATKLFGADRFETTFIPDHDAVFWRGNQVFFHGETNTAAVPGQMREPISVPEPATVS
jgi:hypothetical protein